MSRVNDSCMYTGYENAYHVTKSNTVANQSAAFPQRQIVN